VDADTKDDENPRLPHWVPGGHPMNPLGVRALYLGSSAYRIHGTDAPWTIGTAVSKGCIRMYNQDVLDLYPRVSVGATVTVTWQNFNSAKDFAYTRSSSRPPLREMQQSDLPHSSPIRAGAMRLIMTSRGPKAAWPSHTRRWVRWIVQLELHLRLKMRGGLS
jgi:hypothetical protein